MPKILSLSLEDEDLLCELAASLSSPARIQTLKLLYFNSYSVGEIAEKLNIPYSSASCKVVGERWAHQNKNPAGQPRGEKNMQQEPQCHQHTAQ